MAGKKVVCPICKNPFEYEGSGDTECPVCGYGISESDIETKAARENEERKAETYRLMSAADAYFSRKGYDEAYIGYGAVLSSDPECVKAVFRRELASQYLTYECSTVYLSCDGFFTGIENIKKRIDTEESGEESDRLKLTVCADMIEFISYRADYEKKFAETDESGRNSGAYTANLIRLFEYTGEILKYLVNAAEGFDRNLAFAEVSCCGAGKKIYDMLFGESAKESLFDVDMLDGSDRIKMKALCGNMENTRNDIIKNADEVLLNRINISEEKRDVRAEGEAEDSRRMEREQWRKRNEEKYYAADKEILIFGISAKAALCFAAVMTALFIFEAAVHEEFMKGAVAFAVLFAAAQIVFTALRKNAEKRKSHYFDLINGRGTSAEKV